MNGIVPCFLCIDVLTLIGILFPFLIEKSGLVFLLTNSCCSDTAKTNSAHHRHKDNHKHHGHTDAEHSAPLLSHDDLANDACCTEVESGDEDSSSIVSISSENSESCRTGTVQVRYDDMKLAFIAVLKTAQNGVF